MVQQQAKLALVLAIALVGSAALAQTQTEAAQPNSSDQAKVEVLKLKPSEEASAFPRFYPRDPRYRVGPGDSFDVNFTYTPEYNQTLVVQPDGFVYMRGVGDVKVGGLDVPHIHSLMVSKYSQFLNDPEVTIELKQFEKPYFIAGGEVTRPGRYDLEGALTLSEALEVAGGLTKGAKRSQLFLVRRTSPDEIQLKRINIKAVESGHFQEDVQIEPGDFVYVSKSTSAKIKDWLPHPGVSLSYFPHY